MRFSRGLATHHAVLENEIWRLYAGILQPRVGACGYCGTERNETGRDGAGRCVIRVHRLGRSVAWVDGFMCDVYA